MGRFQPTHGHTRQGARLPEYRIWYAMKDRCHNENSPAYKNYGGRGITVCDKWRNDFAAFLADVGFRPAGMTLDRIDNEKGYEPGNVRWATYKQQANNTRRRVISPEQWETVQQLLSGGGSLSEAARTIGFTRQAVWRRLRSGC